MIIFRQFYYWKPAATSPGSDDAMSTIIAAVEIIKNSDTDVRF